MDRLNKCVMTNKTKLKFEELFDKLDLAGSTTPEHKTAAKVAKQHETRSQFLNKIEESKSEGPFNEMYDTYDEEEAHQKAKFAPNHLPQGDTKIEDSEDYSEDDMESLGLKDAASDEEKEAEEKAEDAENVEITPEDKSKFAILFKAAMKDLNGEDQEDALEDADANFNDKLQALEDKALMAKMDRAAKEEDAEEKHDEEDHSEDNEHYDSCEHCSPEDEYCDHCGEDEELDSEEDDKEEEDVVEENRFDKAWSKMNSKRVQEEGRRKTMSVGAILGAAEQGEKVGADGKAIPNEDQEHCDAEECDKHEDRKHNPEDHYGHEGAAYDLKASEVSEEEEPEEEEDDKDVVEEGTLSYMSQVQKVDQMLEAPTAPVALVAESAVIEPKLSERQTFNNEKSNVAGYAGSLTKALK